VGCIHAAFHPWEKLSWNEALLHSALCAAIHGGVFHPWKKLSWNEALLHSALCTAIHGGVFHTNLRFVNVRKLYYWTFFAQQKLRCKKSDYPWKKSA